MSEHQTNLDRVRRHRRDRVSLAMLDAAIDHVEDVFTRHAPFLDALSFEQCDICSMERTYYFPWPCDDYKSALNLFDALSGADDE